MRSGFYKTALSAVGVTLTLDTRGRLDDMTDTYRRVMALIHSSREPP